MVKFLPSDRECFVDFLARKSNHLFALSTRHRTIEKESKVRERTPIVLMGSLFGDVDIQNIPVLFCEEKNVFDVAQCVQRVACAEEKRFTVHRVYAHIKRTPQ